MRWFSERHISTSAVQDKSQTTTIKNIKVGLSSDFSSKSTSANVAANAMSHHDASNQSYCNKTSNNIYNVHVNNTQSKANNSILNPIGNDVGQQQQQHGSMKNNNNVIMSMSLNDKFQLVYIIIIFPFLSYSLFSIYVLPTTVIIVKSTIKIISHTHI